MEKGYLKGNSVDYGKESKNWIIGHFKSDPMMRSQDVEVKWDTLEKYAENEAFAAQAEGMTVSILIRGHMMYEFRGPPKTHVGNLGVAAKTEYEHHKEYLSNEGDFVIWKPLVYHWWKALEDSLVVTVRWPSKKSDVYTMPRD
jgi:hypothetical protein